MKNVVAYLFLTFTASILVFALKCSLDVVRVADNHTTDFHQTLLPHDEIDANKIIHTVTIPGSFLVRILPAKEYETKHPGTAGIAFFKLSPCTIEIPDSWPIDFIPYENDAWFHDRQNSDTLAHEILHCIIPDWHDGFTARLLQQRR